MQISHRCASPRFAAKSTTPNNFQKLAGLHMASLDHSELKEYLNLPNMCFLSLFINLILLISPPSSLWIPPLLLASLPLPTWWPPRPPWPPTHQWPIAWDSPASVSVHFGLWNSLLEKLWTVKQSVWKKPWTTGLRTWSHIDLAHTCIHIAISLALGKFPPT